MPKYKNADVKAAYQKERRRIKRYVSDMKKRGYETEDVSIPKIPKTVTEASVRNLQKIDSGKLRGQMYTLNPYTGEMVSAKNRVGTARIRREIKNDPLLARAALRNFMEEVYAVGNEYAVDYMESWLNEWVGRDGEELVGFTLEDAARRGIRFTVNYSDSYETVIKKSVWFVRETLRLSGEYSEESIDDYIDYLQSEW